MIYSTFVTLAALTLSQASGAASPAPAQVHSRLQSPPAVDRVHWDGLYSLRARRRFAAYLRLRLLEMRKAGLDRAAAVIERKLPVDDLMPKR